MSDPIYTAPKPKRLFITYYVFAALFLAMVVASAMQALSHDETDYKTLAASGVFLFFAITSWLVAYGIKRVRLWDDSIELLNYNGTSKKRIYYKDVTEVKERGRKSKMIGQISFTIKTEREKMRVHFYMHNSAYKVFLLNGIGLHKFSDYDTEEDFTYQGLPITDHKTMYAFIKHELETKARVNF